ncbi:MULTISPECIES: 6,7-dimethyl-8-ribityllumazine synthase [Asticcacaulis]|uniref:6,7-dimethyl-8-ribityllumazine synthase n=1 Tax=Asticcacaulis endophyticus TaxID=1395890 RepID=A0A918QBJ7_9CAUL|nr:MULTISPECIES: 6,7-dimethyl-8-ribityllumazine synthase [Asticcacaulis]WAC48803.1 6,7-dimethyl-8-ribityllumazine synthase [Asticcacaulis sp. SL142]GGZ40956.1 6,7-dimethyl-8-ribityllumazine synthase [Asticcacaulis endophyticus]
MSQEQPLRILIVESRFYDDISDELLAGAKSALEAYGAEYDVVTVPGAFEVPAAIAMAEDAAHRPTGRYYDGYVALGCVIRGDTTHYDYVCTESARGLMDLSMNQRLAIGYGILTVEDEDQAWVRARRSEGDKGGTVAKVCLDMISLRKSLLGGGVHD